MEFAWSFQTNVPIFPSGSAVPDTKIFLRSVLSPDRSDAASNCVLPSMSRKNWLASRLPSVAVVLPIGVMLTDRFPETASKIPWTVSTRRGSSLWKPEESAR